MKNAPLVNRSFCCCVKLFACLFFYSCDAKKHVAENPQRKIECSHSGSENPNSIASSRIFIPSISINNLEFPEALVVINKKIDEQVIALGLPSGRFRIVNHSTSKSVIYLDLKHVSIKTLMDIVCEQSGLRYDFAPEGMIVLGRSRDFELLE